MGRFLDFHLWEPLGAGEEGGSDQPGALQLAGQVQETTGPIQGCHLLRSTEGGREEGVALFSHFMFLRDLKNRSAFICPAFQKYFSNSSSGVCLLGTFLNSYFLEGSGFEGNMMQLDGG